MYNSMIGDDMQQLGIKKKVDMDTDKEFLNYVPALYKSAKLR